MTISILNVAEYVVSRRENKRMSRQMLHSVLYFVQERYVEKEGEPLFKETFLKKGLFPCSAVLDAAFTNQGYIEQKDLAEFRKKLNQKHRVVIDEVLEEFTNSTSKTIAMKLSGDKAWESTSEGKVITVKALKGEK
jgi:hypothetical protein